MRIIGGNFRGRRLAVPKTGVRPTSERLREALFNICQGELGNVLELFAGTGAVGLEALSRGARHVTFVEQDPKVAAILRKNIERLDVSKNTTVVVGDALAIVKRLRGTYDLIFADPPYDRELGVAVIEAIGERDLLSEGGRLFVEESSKEELEEIPPGLVLKKVRQYGRGKLFELERDQ